MQEGPFASKLAERLDDDKARTGSKEEYIYSLRCMPTFFWWSLPNGISVILPPHRGPPWPNSCKKMPNGGRPRARTDICHFENSVAKGLTLENRASRPKGHQMGGLEPKGLKNRPWLLLRPKLRACSGNDFAQTQVHEPVARGQEFKARVPQGLRHVLSACEGGEMSWELS